MFKKYKSPEKQWEDVLKNCFVKETAIHKQTSTKFKKRLEVVEVAGGQLKGWRVKI